MGVTEENAAYPLRPFNAKQNRFQWIIIAAQKLFWYSLALLATNSLAGDWLFIASSGTTMYEARAGTLEHLTTSAQEPIAMVLFRVSDKATGKIGFVRHYVRVADCQRGFGKLGEADVNGNVVGDADFVFGGGNVASIVAEAICLAHTKTQLTPGNSKQQKSF